MEIGDKYIVRTKANIGIIEIIGLTSEAIKFKWVNRKGRKQLEEWKWKNQFRSSNGCEEPEIKIIQLTA